MADADTVRGAGVPDRAPAPGSPAPGSPAPGAAVSGETVMSLVDHLSELRTRLIRCLLAVVALYDLLTLRKVHRATVYGTAWVVFVELAAIWIGPTAAWHNAATYIRLLASAR